MDVAIFNTLWQIANLVFLVVIIIAIRALIIKWKEKTNKIQQIHNQLKELNKKVDSLKEELLDI